MDGAARPGMKRIRVQPKCPNPLFELWLDEWRQEAANKGSDMQYCFGKALKSLRKYPLPLKTGKECAVLECFGDRLCLLLDRKLAEYRKTNPQADLNEDVVTVEDVAENIAPPKKKKGTIKKVENNSNTDASPKLRQHRGREYVPAWRSGPYAILITMLMHERMPSYKGFMKKSELQQEAQPLCDASFTRPDPPGSHYTAWSSMSQLVKKGLVLRVSNPAKFSLSDDGRQLAEQLEKTGEDEGKKAFHSANETAEPSPQTQSPKQRKRSEHLFTNHGPISVIGGKSASELCMPSTSTPSLNENITDASPNSGDTILDPGTFDIILLVDTAETSGASKKTHDQTIVELSELKVTFEVRRLAVGDFLWIARSTTSDVELVLPYIVERKRMDDLGKSVKDSRFREQKFRLKQSGIQNLIYLVESYGDQHLGLPLSTLQQAAVNTQIVDGFIVKHTSDHRHSMAYLASLTSILKRVYLGKTFIACSKEDSVPSSTDDDFIMVMRFKEFNKTSTKVRNFLVKEMFIKHLIQLKGLSVEKAIAIVNFYPTPSALVSALSDQRDENLLADIQFGLKKKRVGPALSRAICHFYSEEKLQ